MVQLLGRYMRYEQSFTSLCKRDWYCCFTTRNLCWDFTLQHWQLSLSRGVVFEKPAYHIHDTRYDWIIDQFVASRFGIKQFKRYFAPYNWILDECTDFSLVVQFTIRSHTQHNRIYDIIAAPMDSKHQTEWHITQFNWIINQSIESIFVEQ